MPTPDVDVPVLAELVLLMDNISTVPLTASQTKSLTHWEKVLARVHVYVLCGWPASASSSATIVKLWALFASHDIPDLVVSDNGSPFVSAEIKDFLAANGVE